MAKYRKAWPGCRAVSFYIFYSNTYLVMFLFIDRKVNVSTDGNNIQRLHYKVKVDSL